MTIDWMSWKEEIHQRHENLILHGTWGLAGGYIAAQHGMELPTAVASSIAFGFVWEVGGNLITKYVFKKKVKPWKASLLGALSYPVGTLAAGAVRSLGG